MNNHETHNELHQSLADVAFACHTARIAEQSDFGGVLELHLRGMEEPIFVGARFPAGYYTLSKNQDVFETEKDARYFETLHDLLYDLHPCYAASWHEKLFAKLQEISYDEES
eukprot:TRINITY_DN39959_c0_g1_i1.p1 TRINITY_DN39959_c0_g1~~TRINITY_DN39959_c0_g1_i1.p1  ORF type:complete len:112 (-),score=11.02 TRINITY_DN39959_c0_g1_i1:37-372(-)